MSNQIARNDRNPRYGFNKIKRVIRTGTNLTVVPLTDVPVYFNALGTSTMDDVVSYNTGNGIFTALKEGIFMIDATAVFSGEATNSGTRKLFILKSGQTDQYGANNGAITADPGYTSISTSISLFLSVGDTFVVNVNQSNTGSSSLTLISDTTDPNQFTRCEVKYLG